MLKCQNMDKYESTISFNNGNNEYFNMRERHLLADVETGASARFQLLIIKYSQATVTKAATRLDQGIFLPFFRGETSLLTSTPSKPKCSTIACTIPFRFRLDLEFVPMDYHL